MSETITQENIVNELAVCPWCGNKPSVSPSWSGYTISCLDASCRIRPSTSWCDDLESAKLQWNTREES